jgi:hypothetical protein
MIQVLFTILNVPISQFVPSRRWLTLKELFEISTLPVFHNIAMLGIVVAGRSGYDGRKLFSRFVIVLISFLL